MDSEVEEKAKADGWAPKEEWKGDPDKWKTAEEFVEIGEKIPAILKSKVERLEGRVNELLESNKNFNEFSKKALEKEKGEKQQLIKELEEVRKKAVTEGDGDAFDKADKQIDELKKEDPVTETQSLDPLAEKWLSDNQWYNDDEQLQTFADGIAGGLVAKGFTGKAYFDELTKQVKDFFPDKFANKNRKRETTVESGGEVVDSGDRKWANLPKEAKLAYEQFKRDIPGFTKENYLAQYDWE